MELQDYWRTVRRRWRLVLGTVLAVLAIAAVWTWTTTPLYSSSTRLFVSTSQTDENSAYTGNLFATQRVASYADLVTSNQLAERVAGELDDLDATDLREQVGVGRHALGGEEVAGVGGVLVGLARRHEEPGARGVHRSHRPRPHGSHREHDQHTPENQPPPPSDGAPVVLQLHALSSTCQRHFDKGKRSTGLVRHRRGPRRAGAAGVVRGPEAA